MSERQEELQRHYELMKQSTQVITVSNECKIRYAEEEFSISIIHWSRQKITKRGGRKQQRRSTAGSL